MRPRFLFVHPLLNFTPLKPTELYFTLLFSTLMYYTKELTNLNNNLSIWITLVNNAPCRTAPASEGILTRQGTLFDKSWTELFVEHR